MVGVLLLMTGWERVFTERKMEKLAFQQSSIPFIPVKASIMFSKMSCDLINMGFIAPLENPRQYYLQKAVSKSGQMESWQRSTNMESMIKRIKEEEGCMFEFELSLHPNYPMITFNENPNIDIKDLKQNVP